jgi:hypothetical protein
VLVRSFDHGESVFDVVRHGFFAVDIFTGGAGVDKDSAMLVVGDRNDHGVDIFAVEDFFVIARDWNLFLDGLLRGFVPAVVKIADGNAFNAGNVERGGEQFAASGSRSDRGEAHAITGRDGAARAPESGGFQEGCLDYCSGSYGSCA